MLSCKESGVLGGVGVRFLRTLGVGVTWIFLSDFGNPIESFFTIYS